MTDTQLGDIARRKEVLLRFPVLAYSKACGFYRLAVDRHDKEAVEVWAQVVRELEVDGYAPDPAGNLGHAVRSYYEAGVLGAGPFPPQPATPESAS